MHVKRLYRPSVREALAAARQELGPGALVLSTELVPAPGWRGWFGRRVVRLTAAADRPQTTFEHAEVVSDVRSKVSADRHTTLTTAQEGVAARLAAAGLGRAFAEAVAARLTQSECRLASDATLRRAVNAELEAAVPADSPEFARYEVFVGPPGVGKTTTIAKIAAQERASRGRALSLVSADAFRAGAIEQLRSYAAVMGVPFRVARTAGELGDVLGATKQTALVDTAGQSPADSSLGEVFDVIAGHRGVRTHLVLAADTSPKAAKRIVSRYAAARPSHAVITKIDEAESLIPLFNVLQDEGLPVSFLANGQRVPDDLRRATPANLAATLLHEDSREAAWQ